jgi:hypothetical protein
MRLVVAGTPGAGKSTFVRTASDIEVVDTDRTATDETSSLKKKTTVAFDFGRLSFGSMMELRIYGTPGQDRFSFMWDFLIQNAHTYTLLIAAHRPGDLNAARKILNFMNQRVQIPMAIGLTHADLPGALTADEVMLRLGFVSGKERPPIITVNPTDRGSVIEAIMTSMALLLAKCDNSNDRVTKRSESRSTSQLSSRSTYKVPMPQYSRRY